MRITDQSIVGVKLIEPQTFPDGRGWFVETYQSERYRDAGITDAFVQDNFSFSRQNVLRGLHFVRGASQAQLFFVSSGEAFAVVADVRPSSPTFGHWWSTVLDTRTCRQVYMAPGLACGFLVTGEHACMHYKVSRAYEPEIDGGVFWNDPALAIEWPTTAPNVSARDAAFPMLSDIPAALLPQVEDTMC